MDNEMNPIDKVIVDYHLEADQLPSSSKITTYWLMRQARRLR